MKLSNDQFNIVYNKNVFKIFAKNDSSLLYESKTNEKIDVLVKFSEYSSHPVYFKLSAFQTKESYYSMELYIIFINFSNANGYYKLENYASNNYILSPLFDGQSDIVDWEKIGSFNYKGRKKNQEIIFLNNYQRLITMLTFYKVLTIFSLEEEKNGYISQIEIIFKTVNITMKINLRIT